MHNYLKHRNVICEGDASLTLVKGQIQTFLVHEMHWIYNFERKNETKVQEEFTPMNLEGALELKKQKEVARIFNPMVIYSLSAFYLRQG